MPTDKHSHKMHKKNSTHKKCGARIGDAPACRHTAKKNGRCHAHSGLAKPIMLQKEAEKKRIKAQKRAAMIKKAQEKPPKSEFSGKDQ